MDKFNQRLCRRLTGAARKATPPLAILGLLLVCGCFTVRNEHVYEPPNADQPPSAAIPPAAQGADLQSAALRELLNLSESRDPEVHCNALEALQTASPDYAVDPAIAALDDDIEEVRFAGCIAVGTLKIEQAHEQLLKMKDADASRVVQVGVRFALHKLGDTRFSHDLEGFCHDPDAQVRGKAAFVLGRLGEPSAIGLLLPMRQDPEEAVRLEASSSLWLLGNQVGLDDLAAYAISKYADDLIIATLALAAPHDRQVIQHVRANLSADYPEVELAAARGLGMLGSDEGYGLAMKYLSSSDALQRSMAAQALGSIGKPDAAGALGSLLSDPEPQVRLSAAAAILELKGNGG